MAALASSAIFLPLSRIASAAFLAASPALCMFSVALPFNSLIACLRFLRTFVTSSIRHVRGQSIRAFNSQDLTRMVDIYRARLRFLAPELATFAHAWSAIGAAFARGF